MHTFNRIETHAFFNCNKRETAVDTDEVYMTTQLEGKKTFWIPFNKGHNYGKGNPLAENNYRTAYLWEEILAKDSWLEIIKRFIHLQTDEKEIAGPTRKIEKLIFPRFHQLDAAKDLEDEIREMVEQSCKTRGQQQNLSFFAFTATPKYKTLAVFGQKNSAGKPEPFHLYSMRQAIEEGFILDVLANYITYSLFFKLSKAIEDDPEMNKKKAAQAIGRFVSLHPHNLAQKTEVIIEHFRQVVAEQIGGRAKAMLVTGSRLHAKRYYDEFQCYLKAKKYNDMKVLVAFSGKVLDDDCPDGIIEPQLTGCSEKELPQLFEQEEIPLYRKS